MLNDPHHRGSQDTGKGADADRRAVDWQKVFLTDPVLAEVLKYPDEDKAQRTIGPITSVAEFHRVLEERFFKKYFGLSLASSRLYFEKDGKILDYSYFPDLKCGSSSSDTLEFVRRALYTKLYAHWFAQVYMVERYGIERFERETGTPTLAGLFDSLKINNPREQLFVLYQIISRNLRDTSRGNHPGGKTKDLIPAPAQRPFLRTILASLFDSLKINNPREQLFVYQLIAGHLHERCSLNLPEVLTKEHLSGPHQNLLRCTIAGFQSFACEQERERDNKSPPYELYPNSHDENYDFESVLREINHCEHRWLSERETPEAPVEDMPPFLSPKLRSWMLKEIKQIYDGKSLRGTSTCYRERSSCVQFHGFDPAEVPSRVARSCINDPRCFTELLDFHFSVRCFVVSYGGRDHDILSGWGGYRRLLTHCILDQGVQIKMSATDAMQARQGTDKRSPQDMNREFKIDSIFRIGEFGLSESPFSSRLHFHLFIHDCGHFLLGGFYEPGFDFELFRLAWIGAEHYARWFSDYEVMKRVVDSPYWKDQPPCTPWEELPRETRSALISEMPNLQEARILNHYQHYRNYNFNLHYLWRPHNLYEIIRDAKITDEIQGRDFLLRFNTCPDYESDPIARLPREKALKINSGFEAADALIARLTEQYPRLNHAHKVSLRMQLSRNIQDLDYIAVTYDEAYWKSNLSTLFMGELRDVSSDYSGRFEEDDWIPRVKVRTAYAVDFISHNLWEEAQWNSKFGVFHIPGMLDDDKIDSLEDLRKIVKDRYFEPPKNTLETFASFTDRALFDQRFADTPLEQRAKVWSYLSRCGAVMKYLMDDSPNTEAKSEES